jgi:hypothetical protein
LRSSILRPTCRRADHGGTAGRDDALDRRGDGQGRRRQHRTDVDDAATPASRFHRAGDRTDADAASLVVEAQSRGLALPGLRTVHVSHGGPLRPETVSRWLAKSDRSGAGSVSRQAKSVLFAATFPESREPRVELFGADIDIPNVSCGNASRRGRQIF